MLSAGSARIDRKQAENAADALLEPGRATHREAALERQAIHAGQALQRRRGKVAAWCMLVGAGIGALLAHGAGQPVGRGIATGALAGVTVGWLVASWTVRA